MFVCSAVAGVATPEWPHVKAHRRRPPATVSRPRPPRPADAGPTASARPAAWTCGSGWWGDVERRLSGRRLEPMLLLLPLDVASRELLLDELEAELQHRGGIIDRHAGPVAADGHAEPLGGPLGVGTERRRSRPTSRGTRCPVLSPFRRAITAPPFARAAPCKRPAEGAAPPFHQRVGEVFGMTADRIDLERRQVTVDRQMQRYAGQDGVDDAEGGGGAHHHGAQPCLGRAPSTAARPRRGLLFQGLRGALLRRDQFSRRRGAQPCAAPASASAVKPHVCPLAAR